LTWLDEAFEPTLDEATDWTLPETVDFAFDLPPDEIDDLVCDLPPAPADTVDLTCDLTASDLTASDLTPADDPNGALLLFWLPPSMLLLAFTFDFGPATTGATGTLALFALGQVGAIQLGPRVLWVYLDYA